MSRQRFATIGAPATGVFEMSKQSPRSKPLTLMIGASLGLGAFGAQAAPLFQATDLAAGYAVASAGDEAKKPAEGSCGGEGGCGADMSGGSDKKADTKTEPKPAPAPPPKK
jgi:hypothetical protein